MATRKHRTHKAGLPPGTLLYHGERKTEEVIPEIIIYSKNEQRKVYDKEFEKYLKKRAGSEITWINFDGIHDIAAIEKIQKQLKLHPLIAEDIVTPDQRPRFEDQGSYLYIVLNMIYFKDRENSDLVSEQISLIVTKNMVLTFQQMDGDVFDIIRNRIERGKGFIRSKGADYLAYSLLDAIVDNYFIILEDLGEKIEILEDEMIQDPKQSTLKHMYQLKKNVLSLSRSVWPLRTVVNNFNYSGSALLNESTKMFLKDIHDHLIHIIDTIEIFRSLLSEMVEIYLNSINNKLNEVMKILTVVATIFMPLSFLAGVWGMNFKHMPELQWQLGYPLSLTLMAILFILMILTFKRKKWI